MELPADRYFSLWLSRNPFPCEAVGFARIHPARLQVMCLCFNHSGSDLWVSYKELLGVVLSAATAKRSLFTTMAAPKDFGGKAILALLPTDSVAASSAGSAVLTSI